MLDSISKAVEEARLHTNSSIRSIQKSLLPEFIDTKYQVRNNYMYNEQLIYDRENIIIKLEHIKYKSIVVNNKRDVLFQENLKECVDKDHINPFLLFINGLHVKWSDITVIRDYKFSYLKINKKTMSFVVNDIKSVKILNIPFPIIYTETREERNDKSLKCIFRFALNGTALDNGKVIIYTRYPFIEYKELSFLNGNIINADIDVPSDMKLSTNNFVVFKDKVLLYDNNLSIRNTNLLNMKGEVGQYRIKLFYRTDVNKSVDNIMSVPNATYLRQLMKGQTSNSAIDLATLEKEFDFEFDPVASYEENIHKAMLYLSGYNAKHVAKIYENARHIYSIQLTGEKVRELANPVTGLLTMLRMKFKEKETYVVVFYNGLLYKFYTDLQYQLSTFTLPIDLNTLEDSDTFEFVFFKNVNNYAETIKLTRDNRYKTQRAFEDGELLLYAKDPKKLDYEIELSDRSMYPVGFSINKLSEVIPDDPYYYDKDLLYTTKNQFRYFFQNIQTRTVKVRLSPDFQGALNPKQYMVFYNGRLMNKNFYKLLIENRDNTYIEPWIYSRIALNPGDRLEVIYAPAAMNQVNYGQDMTVEIDSVVAAKDSQTSFLIPYPFKLYKERFDFIVLLGNVFVDRRRYTTANGILTFIDGTFIPKGKKVSYIFCYEKSNPNDAIKYVTDSSVISMESNCIPVEAEGQTDFQLNPDYIPYLMAGNDVIVTYKGLYVNSRYYTVDRYNGKIKFIPNHLKKGTAINVVVCYMKDAVVTKTQEEIVATEDGANSFVIPEPFGSYIAGGTSVLVMRNGILLTKDIHYSVLTNLKSISFNKSLDKGDKFQLLGFESSSKTIKVYERSIEIETDGQTEFELDGTFKSWTDSESRFIVYLGSLIVDPRRYSVIDGKLVFDSPRGMIRGRHIRMVCMYLDSNETASSFNGEGSSRYNKMENHTIITEKGKTVYDIPVEEALLDGKSFFLTSGSILIDTNRYTKDKYKNTIEFFDKEDPILYNGGAELTFNFIYDDIYNITMTSDTILAKTKNQRLFDVPVPFKNFFRTNAKMLMFIGSTYVDTQRYKVDPDKNTVYFLEEEYIDPNRELKFIFIYIGSMGNEVLVDDEVTITKIQKNGYIYMNKDRLVHPLSKELVFTFLNGRKVDLSSIVEVSTNMMKINKDMQSRYNLVLLDYTPEIPALVEYYSTYSDFDTVINNIEVDDLNLLFNANEILSETEPHHDMNVANVSVINEITRDFFMANNIYQGDVFKYTGEDSVMVKNADGDIFITAANADDDTVPDIDRTFIND